MKEYLLLVNIRSIQDLLPLTQVLPLTRVMKFSLFVNDNRTGCDVSKLKSPKQTYCHKCLSKYPEV